jgi:hypothetical protein
LTERRVKSSTGDPSLDRALDETTGEREHELPSLTMSIISGAERDTMRERAANHLPWEQFLSSVLPDRPLNGDPFFHSCFDPTSQSREDHMFSLGVAVIILFELVEEGRFPEDQFKKAMMNISQWIVFNLVGGRAAWDAFLYSLDALGAYDATITILTGYPDEQLSPEITYQDDSMVLATPVSDADANTQGTRGCRAIFQSDKMEVIVDDQSDFESITEKALTVQLACVKQSACQEHKSQFRKSLSVKNLKRMSLDHNENTLRMNHEEAGKDRQFKQEHEDRQFKLEEVRMKLQAEEKALRMKQEHEKEMANLEIRKIEASTPHKLSSGMSCVLTPRTIANVPQRKRPTPAAVIAQSCPPKRAKYNGQYDVPPGPFGWQTVAQIQSDGYPHGDLVGEALAGFCEIGFFRKGSQDKIRDGSQFKRMFYSCTCGGAKVRVVCPQTAPQKVYLIQIATKIDKPRYQLNAHGEPGLEVLPEEELSLSRSLWS